MKGGAGRLAVLIGIIGVVSWLIAVAVMTKVFTNMDHSFRVWGTIIGISALCFIGPFGFVHGIAWVVRGFRRPPENRHEQ
jgi:hypothetical protein